MTPSLACYPALIVGLLFAVPVALPDTKDRPPPPETIEVATCRLIESAAGSAGLPVNLLTRLLWAESRFRADVTSPAGAQGVAQFMPETATDRGLADPYDPSQAIPHAAALLADLRQQFGNLGLAVAAYNAGPVRVSSWLAGRADLPRETLIYVVAVTGYTPDDWAGMRWEPEVRRSEPGSLSCLEFASAHRVEEHAGEPPIAPEGIHLQRQLHWLSLIAPYRAMGNSR